MTEKWADAAVTKLPEESDSEQIYWPLLAVLAFSMTREPLASNWRGERGEGRSGGGEG